MWPVALRAELWGTVLEVLLAMVQLALLLAIAAGMVATGLLVRERTLVGLRPVAEGAVA